MTGRWTRVGSVVLAAALVGVLAWPTGVTARSDGTELPTEFPQAISLYGLAVGISGDVIVSGQPNFDAPAGEGTINNAGIASTFRRDAVDTTLWNDDGLLFTESGSSERFGFDVDVDGDLVICGAPRHDSGQLPHQTGIAVLFRKVGLNWTLEETLVATDPGDTDRAGTAVAVSGDIAVVGAPFRDSLVDGGMTQLHDNGEVFVFARVEGSWTHVQSLVASDAFNGQLFGAELDLEGDTLIVGTPGGEGPHQDAPVYVFERNGGAFVEVDQLRPPGAPDYDRFGNSIDIDGDTFIVGAPETRHGGNGSTVLGAGAAYVYVYDDLEEEWALQQRLDPEVAGEFHQFGIAVALSGERAFVGVSRWTGSGNDALSAEGRVEQFTRSGGAWLPTEVFTRPTPQENAQFGGSVAADGDTLVVGAYGADNSAGGTTVFEIGGNVPPPQTVRAFVLPKSIKFRPSGAAKSARPTIQVKAFFDTGPDPVDLTRPGTLTVGPLEYDIDGLDSVKGGKKFVHEREGLAVTIVPSKLGSSKGRLSVKVTDLVIGDADGPFTVRYQTDQFDAAGTVRLENGGFRFGKKAGSILAPELDIRKAKANLPGRGRHAFKFVAGFTTEGTPPPTPPSVTVAFGSILRVQIPADQLRAKNGKFTFNGNRNGIREVVIDYRKERIAVRGTGVDLGDVNEGPQPLLLILTQDDDTRAVLVRAVRRKKNFQY